MSESGKIDKELYIHRFLSNALSAEERHAFQEWLDKSIENKMLYNQIAMIWDASEQVKSDYAFDYQSALNRHKEQLSTSYKPATKTVNFLNFKLYTAAAAIIIILLAVTFLFIMGSDTEVIHTQAVAQRILLEDKSEVWINSESELKIFDFTNSVRKVALKGVAYFDIEKNTDKVFVIETRNFSVEVTGTSFNVNALKDEVFVTSGSVIVKNKNDEVRLSAGEGVRLLEGTFIKMDSVPSHSDMLDWVNPDLTFDNTPFHRVIRDIEIKYNIRIVVDDQADLSSCVFTSGSMKGSSLEEVFSILKLTYDMNIEQTDLTVYQLSGIACK